MAKKNVVILGSTGSIGINTLKVVKRYSKDFNVVGLTAYSNVKLLEKQVREFAPSHIAVRQENIKHFQRTFNEKKIKVLDVEEQCDHLVSLKNVDVVIIAMRGSAALIPFLTAVRNGKIVAPANKEALVIAGDLLMREARKHKATILPIDSEQSAIFQCINDRDCADLKKVLLTASGGALLNVPESKFPSLSVEKILNHPRWKMGKKITVDSALLMNKGFEIIEAMRLFNLKVDDIEVIVHPEAIIHSMVEFVDGSIIAQLGVTDMRLPIQYALTYPKRMPTGLKRLSFFDYKQFNFAKPDYKKFPSLALAIDVAKKDGTLPSVLNAADEEAVDAFLNRKIRFNKIYDVVEKVVKKHKIKNRPNLNQIIEADVWAREEAQRYLG